MLACLSFEGLGEGESGSVSEEVSSEEEYSDAEESASSEGGGVCCCLPFPSFRASSFLSIMDCSGSMKYMHLLWVSVGPNQIDAHICASFRNERLTNEYDDQHHPSEQPCSPQRASRRTCSQVHKRES